MKPIVSQLVVEPPASLEEYSCIPSIKEVDDLLVDCVGQMAVTAGTDLLWKPLNHEVSDYFFRPSHWTMLMLDLDFGCLNDELFL